MKSKLHHVDQRSLRSIYAIGNRGDAIFTQSENNIKKTIVCVHEAPAVILVDSRPDCPAGHPAGTPETDHRVRTALASHCDLIVPWRSSFNSQGPVEPMARAQGILSNQLLYCAYKLYIDLLPTRSTLHDIVHATQTSTIIGHRGCICHRCGKTTRSRNAKRGIPPSLDISPEAS